MTFDILILGLFGAFVSVIKQSTKAHGPIVRKFLYHIKTGLPSCVLVFNSSYILPVMICTFQAVLFRGRPPSDGPNTSMCSVL